MTAPVMRLMNPDRPISTTRTGSRRTVTTPPRACGSSFTHRGRGKRKNARVPETAESRSDDRLNRSLTRNWPAAMNEYERSRSRSYEASTRTEHEPPRCDALPAGNFTIRHVDPVRALDALRVPGVEVRAHRVRRGRSGRGRAGSGEVDQGQDREQRPELHARSVTSR